MLDEHVRAKVELEDGHTAAMATQRRALLDEHALAKVKLEAEHAAALATQRQDLTEAHQQVLERETAAAKRDIAALSQEVAELRPLRPAHTKLVDENQRLAKDLEFYRAKASAISAQDRDYFVARRKAGLTGFGGGGKLGGGTAGSAHRR